MIIIIITIIMIVGYRIVVLNFARRDCHVRAAKVVTLVHRT